MEWSDSKEPLDLINGNRYEYWLFSKVYLLDFKNVPRRFVMLEMLVNILMTTSLSENMNKTIHYV